MGRLESAWRIFSAAPHRMFFWMGSLFATVSILVWSIQQTSIYTPLLTPVFWELPLAQAHAFMMIYGVFGFYFFGFLLTTFPRWLDGDPIPRSVYLGAWACISIGSFGFLAGLPIHRGVSIAGVTLMIAGYAIGLQACLRILARSKSPRRVQQQVICLGLAMGMAGMAAAGYSFQFSHGGAYRAARWIGVYGFVLPIVLSVVFRMVPFFSRSVTPDLKIRQSAWSLPLVCVALLARGILGFQGAAAVYWIPDLILLGVLGAELVLWQFWRANQPPLLRILYFAVGWIAFSFVLSAGESLFLLVTGAHALPFRNAALHALTVGGFGSLLLGISTRVTLGHSGGGLKTNRMIHALFFGFQIVPLLRIAPEIAGFWIPALSVHTFWSGWLWVAAFGLWFLVIAPILVRPRSDGRPG